MGGEASGIWESKFLKVRNLSNVDFLKSQNTKEKKEKFLKG
jgi:hypothetical protein